MKKQTRNRGYSHLFSGAGIGLLVGMLIGLSISPVVGAVLAGLTALLAAFLGLSDKKLPGSSTPMEDQENGQRFREYRAGSFGFACAVGLLLGLFIRTHNLLGVSLQDQHKSWVDIGFSEMEARQLLVYKELGILSNGQLDVNTDVIRRPDISVLYTGRREICMNLAPERYANTRELLYAWNLQRNGNWQSLAVQIENSVPEEYQDTLIETVWSLACEPEE